MAMADVNREVNKAAGKKETEDAVFIRRLAASYNKNAYDGKDRVLEIHYTDIDKTYQILLGKDGSKVCTDGSLSSTTCIITSYEVWASIARGEIGAGEALGKQMYTVSGDFSLMTSWNKYFGNGTAEIEDSSEEGLKKPSMTTMLIPWIVYWTAISFDPKRGSMIALVVFALTPLLMRHHRFVIWDRLSLVAVAILSASAYMLGEGDATAIAGGYLVFGLMWLGSCLINEPLSATYVKYKYGGDRACRNLLFMKTNYILSACWGVLYVLTAVLTWVLRSEGLGNMSLIVNNVLPVGMGVFTVWFQKWYPAYLASGGGRKNRRN